MGDGAHVIGVSSGQESSFEQVFGESQVKCPTDARGVVLCQALKVT
jgi:hypothetical protein